MAEDKNDFDYVVDRFADIEVLRYPVPDFDKLSLSQKMLVYHLTEAALAGRDILWDQNCRLNLELRDMLEKIYTGYQGDRNDPQFKALRNTSNRYGSPTASTTTTRWTNSPRNSPESGLCRSS